MFAQLIDQLFWVWDSNLEYLYDEFASRALWHWLLFFMPFYIFGEFPRYILPGIVLSIMKFLGIQKKDDELKEIFLAGNPKVSILIAGMNEEASIANCIDSVLEIPYENKEIIVIDDNSTDRMYEIARPYEDRGEIKLYRNSAASGRAGRPTSSNMGLFYSTGDFILSVDADTSFDRDTIFHMIGPFYDPKIGAVAGNLKVRNWKQSFWTKMQALEYPISIGLWKRWLDLFGMNMQASGAFGAFRREALVDVGAWDPELAEDADLSLKAKKSGWKIRFAPYAIAMTNAPHTRKILTNQRIRWDKGALRTYFHKHGDMLKFWRYDLKSTFELLQEYLFTVVMTFVYVPYFIIMLFYDVRLLAFILAVSTVVYGLSALITVCASLLYSERWKDELSLLIYVPLFPLYKGYFRWVRVYALTLEMFRWNYEESYIPHSGYRNAPKW